MRGRACLTWMALRRQVPAARNAPDLSDNRRIRESHRGDLAWGLRLDPPQQGSRLARTSSTLAGRSA